MLQNYFRTAWRNIRAHKAYAAINITGLSVGIAASLLIFVIIRYETNWDRFEKNHRRIYRVVGAYSNPTTHEVKWRSSSTTPLLSTAVRNDLKIVENVAEVWNIGGAQIHIPIPGKDLTDEKRFKQNDGLYFAEPQLFSIFDYTWLAGNAGRLTEPNTCVLNQSLAQAFFGDWKKAMGQTLQLWSFRIPMQVVGVFKDLPANTDVEIKMSGSFATFRKINSYMFEHEDWGAAPWPSQCYVLLPPNADPAKLNAGLHQLVRKYYPVPEPGKPVTSLSAQPLTTMHLDTDYGTYKGDGLTPKELLALGLTGFFLLLVACVNFINLSTAQSVNRAKEIGVRKVLGSSRPQILRQFLGETAVLTIAAVVLGILLARLALPFISQLTRKPLSLDILQEPLIALFIAGLGICVNLLAGFYPGLVLAGFNPVQAIKSKIMAGSAKGIVLRRGLVVFQFVIAQLLIIGTIVVLQQMHYFRHQPMGFDSNAVAFIDLPSDSTDQEQHNYLKAQMLAIPGVQAASYTMEMPASWGGNNNNFYYNASPVKRILWLTSSLQIQDTCRLFGLD
ncbi:MAG: ABC transporter permease [Chitinophagaceae bacterium]